MNLCVFCPALRRSDRKRNAARDRRMDHC